jgi:hypothetical protein
VGEFVVLLGKKIRLKSVGLEERQNAGRYIGGGCGYIGTDSTFLGQINDVVVSKADKWS